MTTYIDSFIFFVVAVQVAFSSVGLTDISPPVFNSKVNKTMLSPGEHVLMELELTLPPKTSERTSLDEINPKDEPLFHSKNLILLDKRTNISNDRILWTYQFTAYKSGRLEIPPIELEAGPFTFSTERRLLEVKSSRAGDDWALRKDFEKVALPKAWGRWLALMLVVCASLVCFRLMAPLLRKKPPVPIAIPSPTESPQQWLKRRLSEVKTKIEEEPENDELVDEVSLILRSYFGLVLRKPVDTWTTTEFRKQLGESQSPLLSNLLYECDLFKFREASTRKSPADLAKHFVQQTETLLSPEVLSHVDIG